MEEKTTSIWKEGLKPGIILGLISIISSVIVYVFDLMTVSLFSGIFIFIISLVIFIIAITLLTKSYRNEKLNGFISYGRALLFGLILGIYSSFIASSYSLVFNTVIDPDYEKNTTEKIQELTIQFMQDKGVPDSAIEDAIAKSEKNKKNSNPYKSSLIGIPAGILIAFLASLISSAIAKNNPDPFQQAMQDIDE